jgi:hypothetical protein
MRFNEAQALKKQAGIFVPVSTQLRKAFSGPMDFFLAAQKFQ